MEAWAWAGGFVMGFAFAVFVGWAISWRGKAVARKKAVVTTPTFSGQDYTLSHSDKRIYVTFAAPDGYRYADTAGNALVVTLPGVTLEQEAA